jgi:hypothetical protein
VERVFFPLDEKLELQPGSLTPKQLSHLAHFASVVSFGQAAKLLKQHHGVEVSPSTSRRQTEEIGASAEAVQDEQARNQEKQESAKYCSSEKQVISSDGAHIRLRGNIYTEVKTMTLGEVKENSKRSHQRLEQEVKMTDNTYFSRMIDSQTFTELAAGEIARRGFFQVKQVAAVSDGAEWIQHFVDAHRLDAVRILDFYHASTYVSDIATLVRDAGTTLPESWLDDQLHELKHNGPNKVIEEIASLLQDHPHLAELKQKYHYLQKRQDMMHYPIFQKAGWPIGSGSAESANTHVVQSRMCGAGMFWEPRFVNSMLALRTSECNDRWNEMRQQTFRHRLQLRFSMRMARQKKRYEELKQKVKESILHFALLYNLSKPKIMKRDLSPCESEAVPLSATKNACCPAPSHPWRRYHRAKK